MGKTLSSIAADNPMQLQELASDGVSATPISIASHRCWQKTYSHDRKGNLFRAVGDCNRDTDDGIWIACNSAGFYVSPSVDIKI